jgi:hypothetical protein
MTWIALERSRIGGQDDWRTGTRDEHQQKQDKLRHWVTPSRQSFSAATEAAVPAPPAPYLPEYATASTNVADANDLRLGERGLGHNCLR